MMEQYRIILTKYNHNIIFAYLHQDKPLELQIFSSKTEQLNTIYLGRIEQIVSNINASFVRISKEVKGFLPRADLKPGTMIPVQLMKERTRTKDAVLSDHLSLAGVYCVVHTKDNKISVSSKLSTVQKKQLIKLISDNQKQMPYGVIVRTNAVHATAEEIKNEIAQLSSTLSDIQHYANMRTPGSVLYQAPSEWMRAVSDIRMEYLDEIITDQDDVFCGLTDYLKNVYGESYFSKIKLIRYSDTLVSLKSFYSLEARLDEALKKRVWMKSGGFLIIEPTEALTAIDVNTGKNIKKGNREDTFLHTNLEAAVEIAKQLRLRNLSGMILIDFINMEKTENQKILLKKLSEELKKDPVKAQLHDMTALGLVEVTRMKVRQPLYEQAGLLKKS